MSFPSFTAGDVLTATDMNAVGLWKITEQSASGSATSMSFNNCFSSSYQNYRIMIDYFQPATAGRGVLMRMRVGGVDATANDYFYALQGLYVDSTSSSVCETGVGYANTGLYNSANTIAICSSTIDIYAPNKAERTMMNIVSSLYNSQFGSRVGFAEHNLSTAYDGFTLYLSNTGNITNLRVKVYGYK